MPTRPLSTDEILKRARRDATLDATPSEIIAFRKAGGKVTFDEATGEIDVKINAWCDSAEWRSHLLQHFRQLRHIRSVGVTASTDAFADDIVHSISDSSQLRGLNLSGTGLTDAGLQAISSFPLLESLDVSSTGITDNGLIHCATLTNLSTLSLSRTAITGDGLIHFAALANLSTLSLSGTAISERGLRFLTAAPNLQHLELGGTNVTDNMAGSVQGMPQLITLNLCGSLITDSAIEPLSQLPNLRCIMLTGSLISGTGVERFRKLRPEIEVKWARRLNRIGYWSHGESPGRETEDQFFIHPNRLVDSNWELECRDQIIQYLKSAPSVWHYRGLSLCRFGCGQNGSGEHSDGEWCWPEGLAHYVEQHHVKLPDDFVTHMRQNAFTVPKSETEEFPSTAFWRSWCSRQRNSDD